MILSQKYTSKLGTKRGKTVHNVRKYPSIRGRQADNDFYIAMCNLKEISRDFTYEDADIPTEQRAQRTLRKSRIPRIRDYMLQNPNDYVFSSITASVDSKITFEPVSEDMEDIGTISISNDASITASVDSKITFEPVSEDMEDIGTISISNDASILINDGPRTRDQAGRRGEPGTWTRPDLCGAL